MCLSQTETRKRDHAAFLRSFQVGGGILIVPYLALYSSAAVLCLSKDTKMFYQSNTISRCCAATAHSVNGQWSKRTETKAS